MKKEMIQFKSKNLLEHVVFVDILWEDVLKYRETNLAEIGMKSIFPLWGKASKVLAH